MDEKTIEQKLKKEVESLNGICYKFISPGRKNVPDRLCVLPKGIVFFIECKGSNTPIRKGQIRELVRLKSMDHDAYIVRNSHELEVLFMLMKERIKNA